MDLKNREKQFFFCYKMINFSLSELKFSGNMLVILKGLHH